MRLDKFLCDCKVGTRSEVKEQIKKGHVSVNGSVCKKADFQVTESDSITMHGTSVCYEKYKYIMLYKPAGVVSATEDKTDKTVVDLCPDYKKYNLFPVGRLDKDTEGLLVLTNDGELAHNLLSPSKHVDKCYEVHMKYPLDMEAITALETGVSLGEEGISAPAHVEVISDRIIHLTIREGKFHQVKRMLKAVENEVLYLKRLRMNGLSLDESLEKGQYRELTEEEFCSLTQVLPSFKGIEAVIFDVDGSLVDSMGIWEEIDIEYLGRFGIPVPADLQHNLDGKSYQETAIYFKEHFPIPDSIEKMKADWHEMAVDKYAHEIQLKPGVIPFLKKLKEAGIKTGIATSNSKSLVGHLADNLGLHDYIDVILTGDEVSEGKPSPEIYLKTAKKLQVDPAKCLVFEDVPAGIQAGLRAGMKVCAVRDEYSRCDDVEKHKLADYYLEEYWQLLMMKI